MTNTNTQQDILESLNGASIQHGPLSRRIYLMHLNGADPERLIPALESLAAREGYTKIFAKVPAPVAEAFKACGYVEEAAIPGFYQARETACFLARFLDQDRALPADRETIDKVLEIAHSRATDTPMEPLAPEFAIRLCTPADAEAMSAIYREVFASYPFPIHDPDYLVETMRTHIAYFCVEAGGTLVALSSAEMDTENRNAEMTDFATLPAWRGRGLALQLLRAMETETPRRGIRLACTIARAVSPGMNVTFSRAGYHFAGTLVNNTHISGKIESMNVWHKPLAE